MDTPPKGLIVSEFKGHDLKKPFSLCVHPFKKRVDLVMSVVNSCLSFLRKPFVHLTWILF